ncbi:5'-methylthioadenosine/S-adenosylhomocysteine nucleosidase family protein [Catenibacterium mitsuokai]|uniref:5'-methylthioadenosine/S-adenosylhomocysteine nucleosidase family protein n=1 Tax=Catenibacterium mitsuokai TaxID=100886 RepID=UPI003F900D0A
MREEIVKFILGVDPLKIHEVVIIAPCWKPESVGIYGNQIQNGTCQIWDCAVNNIRFTYIVSGVGAAACLDLVRVLQNTKCKKILFIGSAGALKEGINIGEIAVPDHIICAEGASRYISGNLKKDNFGCKYSVDKKLYDDLINYLKIRKNNDSLLYHTGLGVSVESIALQYDYISEFNEFGCKFIDMESSAFLAAANNGNIRALIIYCISDNISQNEPLYLISDEMIQYRKSLRRKIFPQIIKSFVEKQ